MASSSDDSPGKLSENVVDSYNEDGKSKAEMFRARLMSVAL